MKLKVVFPLACCVLLVGALATFAQQSVPLPEDPLIHQLGVENEPYEALEVGVRGGAIRSAIYADPSGWNPVVTAEAGITQVCSLFLRGLVNEYGVTETLYGELARSWEVSEDGLQITFYLRRGLLWSDGVPFTADDVLFTYNDLHLNEDVDSGLRGGLRLPSGDFPTIEKLDDYTILVTSPEPYRPLLDYFGAFVMPKHKLAPFVHKLNPDVPPGTFNETWRMDTPLEEIVGLGPFLLESHVQGQRVVFRRNPYYYHFDQAGNRLPYLDRIILDIHENLDVTLLQFLNGQVDAVLLRGTDLPLMKPKEVAKGFTVYDGGLTSSLRFLAVNQDTQDDHLRLLFRKLEFRQAIAHALDKETIVNLVHMGQAIPIWSPVHVRSPYYAGREEHGGLLTDQDAVIYDFDLEKAAILLDECGVFDTDGDGIREFEDGRPVEFTLNWPIESITWTQAALIYATDLEKIGIRLVLDAVAWNALVTSLFTGEWEAVMIGLDSGRDPHGMLTGVFVPDARLHFWHYSAAEGDAYPYEERYAELRHLGATTFDIAKVFDYYKEFQIRFATEDLSVIFTTCMQDPFAVYNRFGNAEIIALTGGYEDAEVLQLLYAR
jgi:peptide/nickel transport system substrate-binding protein